MLSDSRPTSGGIRLRGSAQKASPQKPLVSVITAVFNGEAFIASCIESVLSQDYPNIEHIVLDGGSTDGTVAILRKYQDQIAFWQSEPDNGVFDAWNKGLDLACGEWIAFLGADDCYLPGAVSAYIELAQQNPEAEFLSSRARLDHPTGWSPTFGGPWEWPRFATAMSTIHVGTMHHRNLFKRFGKFDSSYRIAGDYEFMLRSRDGLSAAFTPAVTVIMRAGGLSDSTAGYLEARRAKVESGVRSPLRAFIEWKKAVLRFHLRRIFLIFRYKLLRVANHSHLSLG